MPAEPNGGTSQSLIWVTTPSIVWPLRSTVMPGAPMTSPSPGQSLRSFASLTLCVSVCPHVTVLAGVAEAVAEPTASAPASVSATIVAVLRMSLISCLVGWVSERAPSWATTPLARRGSGGARRCRRGS